MTAFAMQCLLLVCCVGPVLAAWRARSAADAAGWWIVALLAVAGAITADPLAVALRHVDGVMTRAICAG